MAYLVWLDIAKKLISNNGSSTFLNFSNLISLVSYLHRTNIALGILVWVPSLVYSIPVQSSLDSLPESAGSPGAATQTPPPPPHQAGRQGRRCLPAVQGNIRCSAVHIKLFDSTVQYSAVQCSAVQYSTVQYSTIQCSTVKYSTVQYNTIQYNTVQYSAV